ncbi:MAG: class I SAM-dependent methyltransferase [Deltaproteobacteria bacterium]|nr:class I SAM-dependent methyltransferase [Deltaproteobacteria bacterium]
MSTEQGDSQGGRAHWEHVHESKSPQEVSWIQEHPKLSLALIERAGIGLDAAILDVGGGVSHLVDHLLERGHSSISVLDISAAALEHTRTRLGDRAQQVSFLVGDALEVELPQDLQLWHDRAVFHFLTEPQARARYAKRLVRCLAPGGYALMATFAEDGPERCSGLPTMRYSAEALHAELGVDAFERVAEEREVHHTPWGGEQRFQYLLLRRSPS